MNEPFFKPRVGAKYEQGYRGAKVLVLGASHYCGTTDCLFFKECTRDEAGTRKHDAECPDYAPDFCLHDAPAVELGNYISNPTSGDYKTYNNFTRWLYQRKPGDPALTPRQKRAKWEHLAFCNLFQYFVPEILTPQIQIPNIRERIEAIINILPAQPDVIVLWGAVLSENLFNHVPHRPCKLGYNNYIVVLCRRDTIFHIVDHPSSPAFKNNDIRYFHNAIIEAKRLKL